MFVITYLISIRMGMSILIHLIQNNCPEFRNGLLDSYFFEQTLGSDCLEIGFCTFALKTILTQLYYKKASQFPVRDLNILQCINRL